MDIADLLDVVMSTDPGTVMHVEVRREEADVIFEVESIDGAKIGEA
jgi:hypothetical protein